MCISNYHTQIQILCRLTFKRIQGGSIFQAELERDMVSGQCVLKEEQEEDEREGLRDLRGQIVSDLVTGFSLRWGSERSSN